MDDLDNQLLALLRSDARRSIASLASELDASRATIRARLDRMVSSGVISGFTIVVRDPAHHLAHAFALDRDQGHGAHVIALRRIAHDDGEAADHPRADHPIQTRADRRPEASSSLASDAIERRASLRIRASSWLSRSSMVVAYQNAHY